MNWHDAREAQIDLYEWATSQQGQAYMQGWADSHASPILRSTYGMLVQAEAAKLSTATPVYVSKEMGELVRFARESFEPETFWSEDLPCPEAFVFFEQPFPIYDRHRREIPIRAFSYCPAGAAEHPGGKWEDMDAHGIVLTIYADVRGRPGFPAGMAPVHMQPVWYGLGFEGEDTDVYDGKETGAREWWTLVQVCLRMMQQHVAARHAMKPGRPTRRRAKRIGFPEEDVVVVRLRREKADTAPEHEPGEAHYSYRFIRAGHWRMQWYPSVKMHRQIWIHQTVVGDESLPLVVKQRAYQWDR